MICTLVIGSFLLACSGDSAQMSTNNCKDGICLELKAEEPLLMNNPTNVTLEVKTERDINGLLIVISAAEPNTQFIDEHKEVQDSGITYRFVEWYQDTKAGDTYTFTTTVQFPIEGLFTLVGEASDPNSESIGVKTLLNVLMTKAGGTANPTPHPIDEIPVVPSELRDITETPSGNQQPLSENRSLSISEVETLLLSCFKDSSFHPFNSEEEAKMTLEISDAIVANASTPITIYFETRKDHSVGTSEENELFRVSLCISSSDAMVADSYQEEVVYPGDVYSQTFDVSIELPGIYDFVAVASRVSTGEYIAIGRRITVTDSLLFTDFLTSGSWQQIVFQGFEGLFPSSGWQVIDLSNDGFDRKWKDDNYRPYTGSWAAWPAKGGVHGIDPALGDHNYPINMNTRMVYGPFDLSDATLAKVEFSLWYEMEATYDHLDIEVSGDGVTFQRLFRWSGLNGITWTSKEISLNNYVGDNSVWVSWRFFSDGTINYDGPWIDDIEISKYVPGQLEVQGIFSFYNRANQFSHAGFTKVSLYDDDGASGDDLLAVSATDGNGYYHFPPRTNWDNDDTSTDPSVRRLDIYIVAETYHIDGSASIRQVTRYDGTNTYKWQSTIFTNVNDGMKDVVFSIPSGNPDAGAIWIFQDMRTAFQFVYSATGLEPGPARAQWEMNPPPWPRPQSSLYWPTAPINGIQIMPDTRLYPDVVIHELGHQYMDNAMTFWLFVDLESFLDCIDHPIGNQEELVCSWTEGWADFLPTAVFADPVFTYGPSINYLNLETIPWPVGTSEGDGVEARVAAALYDLYDNSDDGYDQVSFGFSPIWNILQDTSSQEYTLYQFWNSWKNAGHDKHFSVQAIYQNTIDYDTPPTIDIPDKVMFQNTTRDNAVNLWDCSQDEESSDYQLFWSITYTTEWRCQVTLDGHFLDISIIDPTFLGQCNVTVRVYDGLPQKFGTDTFQISVVPVVSTGFLSLLTYSESALNMQSASDPYPGPLDLMEDIAPIVLYPIPGDPYPMP